MVHMIRAPRNAFVRTFPARHHWECGKAVNAVSLTRHIADPSVTNMPVKHTYRDMATHGRSRILDRRGGEGSSLAI